MEAWKQDSGLPTPAGEYPWMAQSCAIISCARAGATCTFLITRHLFPAPAVTSGPSSARFCCAMPRGLFQAPSSLADPGRLPFRVLSPDGQRPILRAEPASLDTATVPAIGSDEQERRRRWPQADIAPKVVTASARSPTIVAVVVNDHAVDPLCQPALGTKSRDQHQDSRSA